MIEFKSKLRRWGNSFGIVVPQKIIESEKVKEGDEVVIFLKKEESNPLRESFGTFKFKKSTDEIMKEIDQELWKE
jgi:antitoxin component of MazEF toxin-antitoxin module